MRPLISIKYGIKILTFSSKLSMSRRPKMKKPGLQTPESKLKERKVHAEKPPKPKILKMRKKCPQERKQLIRNQKRRLQPNRTN